ncbi:fosfomycin resistance glutathione transferase [Candidatus Riflebacteria bacterium]
MITGINHITLSVKDIAKSFSFYNEVLGFKPVARWPKGAYLLAGDMWIALAQDNTTRSAPLPEYTHIAFSVEVGNFKSISEKIKKSGSEIWQENRSEGDSLYFLDPDGHKLEIHISDLKSRIANAKLSPWEGLEFFV